MQSVKADKLPRNPRESANPLSSLMFCFTMPLLFKGRRKTLEESDLYRPLKEHKSDPLGKKLHRSWDKELHKCQQNNKEPSLLRAVTSEFIWSFAIMGFVLLLLEVGLKISQPIFLGAYVTYFYDAHSDHPKDEQTKAYWYAAGVIGCHSINLLLMHPYTMGILHITMKVRVALRSLIFQKTLRLSRARADLVTSDDVANLMSNDVGRINLSFLHFLWIGPLMVITSTYVMYREIGYSALLSTGFMLFFLYLQFYLTKKTSKLDLQTNIYRNERVTKMTEIITGIKVIKMYAWEIPFGKLIEFLRTKEINAIRHMNYIRGVLLSFVVFVTRFSIFASLLGYVLLGQLLTAESAFVVTAYMNILRSTLYVDFPTGLMQYNEMLLSLKNIKQYLLLEETSTLEKCVDNFEKTGKTNKAFIIQENGKSIDTFDLNRELTNYEDSKKPTEIVISNLKAKWDSKSSEYTLDDVSLSVKPRSLVAVIGPKGSGKTSLIQAILGELPAESGIVTVNGTLSYASEVPWIFGSTLRQNILCGMPMNEERYRTVLEKCGLQYDMDLLPQGDPDTIIEGEYTQSLTEEQKARVSFARAMYRKAAIYLLDDPFKSLETEQSQQLFDRCILDVSKDIVILVTQQIQFLEKVDLIVIMENGRISAVGTYATMCDSRVDFVKLLTVSNEENEIEVEKQQVLRKDKKMHERHNSITSKKSVADADGESVKEKKSKEPGWLKALKLYRKYFAYGASYPRIILMLLCFLTAQLCASGFDYFLSYWIRKIDRRLHNANNFNITIDADFSSANIIEPRLNDDMVSVYVYIFGVFTVTTVCFALARGFLFLNLTTKSSLGLHDDMYNGVTRAAMHFFDSTPTEQILKRFSMDLAELDELVPLLMMEVLQLAMTTFGFDFVLSIVNPWFMIFTASLGFIFFLLRVFYMSTGDDLISLDLKIRGQINSHVSTTLNGISTVRAFGAEKEFTSEFDNYQDIHSSSHYMFLASTRAFGYWIDCVCVSYLSFITLSFFRFAPASAGSVGLGITQAIGMTNLVQRGIKMTIELEHAMPSMTSVADYGTIEAEGELETEIEKKPPKDWPQDGQIVFEELNMRYLPDPKSEFALKSLNFKIQPNQKVGVIGSTGAGKSALVNALYRLSYNDGAVIIDKHDTNDLGLHDLRSKIAIIPEEPLLFSGTMRFNLDPFDEYSDAKLWETLEEVKLKTIISELQNGLQSEISDGDSNFNFGQRQLLCMARAILRGNKILIVDKPDNNIDSQCDALLKSILRNNFKNCTVLMIAQHISSIMDSDKVLVLDNGRVVEFGSPYELLTESQDKIFYDMAKKANNSTFDDLLRVAQVDHESRLKTKME